MLYGLYTGVKLPPLPEYDKSEYPVAFISYDALMDGLTNGETQQWILTLCGSTGTIDGLGWLNFGGSTKILSYCTPYEFSESNEWVVYGEYNGEYSNSRVGIDLTWWGNVERVIHFDLETKDGWEVLKPLWSSYDLKYSGGEVCLAASDPVFAANNGEYTPYYYYNDVLLEGVESDWTDKDTYPYAVVLSRYNGAHSLFQCSKEMFVWNMPDGSIVLGTKTDSGELDTTATGLYSESYGVLWSNTDFYAENGKLQVKGTRAGEFCDESFQLGIAVGMGLKGG